jgi:hypothetical protein
MGEMTTGEMMVVIVFVVCMITLCMIIWEALYFERRGSSRKKTGEEARRPEPNN